MNMKLVFGASCLGIGERTLQGIYLLRAQWRFAPSLGVRSVREVEFFHENFTLTWRRDTSLGYMFRPRITSPARRTVLRCIAILLRAAQCADKKNSDNS